MRFTIPIESVEQAAVDLLKLGAECEVLEDELETMTRSRRVQSVDALRGAIMIVMAIDHRLRVPDRA